ncbi:MAG: hypothetical protein JWO48_1721, partial [Bryobacterales bacterium]|nr:hypothetical protein [Bryobacterales bacterium]
WPSLRELGALVFGLPRLAFCRYVLGRLYLDPGTKILATLDLEQVPYQEWMLRREPNNGECWVSWDVSTDDAAFAARFVPICNEILGKLQAEAEFAVEPMTPDPQADPAAFHEHLRRFAVDTFHSCGGLRMSTLPDALVDPNLRLAGVPNVHALGTAVFPRVGTSNPTLTILALGHRLAQQLCKLPRQ